MAEEKSSGAAPESANGDATASEQAAGAEPALLLNTQYIKDLSFENPNAPMALVGLSEGPAIDVSIDVDVNKLQERVYEVVLTLRVKAASKDTVVFMLELDYAGLASIGQAVGEAESERLLLTDVPRHLFPFARAVVSDMTRDGGFPPLLINPIDFNELYANRKARDRQAATA